MYLALASCASGGDAGGPSAGDDGGTQGPGPDGAAGDSSLGATDSTFPSEVGVVDTSAGDTSQGRAETGPGADSGAGDETSTDDAASGDASGDDTGAGAETGPGDAGGVQDTGTTVQDAGSMDSGSGCPDHGFTGALVTFDLTGQPGDEASFAATASAAGVTGGSLSRSTGLLATTGTDSMNSSHWPQTTTPSKSLYYTFTVTPVAGCSISLTSLDIQVQASPTGPASVEVGTSVDNYTALSARFAGTSTDTVTLSGSAAGAITIHVFGYAATGTGGTLRIANTMTLNGAIN